MAVVAVSYGRLSAFGFCGAEEPGRTAFQPGGGGELSGFHFANTSFQAIHTAADQSQLGFEILDQATQFVGHLGDAVEASVQQCGSLVAVHGPVATEGAVGVTGDAAVTLHQVGQCLVSPVSRVDIGELGDAGDLLYGCRVVGHTVDVQVGGVDAGGQEAQGGRRDQQLLEEFH